ncbi:hypothetical protein GCM10028805_36590 [Spirosoma harenae]
MKLALTTIYSNKKWGYQSEDKSIVIPCTFDYAHEFYFGHVAAVRIGDFWRFITPDGKFASECSYDIQYPYWFRYLVQRDKLWGFVNMFGQEVISCQFEDIVIIDDDTHFGYDVVVTPVCRNGKWGLIDRQNQLVLPCQYDDMGSLYGETVEVKIRNRWRWITFDGRPTNAPAVESYKIFQWRSYS